MVKNTKLYLKFTSLVLCFVVEENSKIKNQESLIPPQEGPGTNTNKTVRGNKAAWPSEEQELLWKFTCTGCRYIRRS